MLLLFFEFLIQFGFYRYDKSTNELVNDELGVAYPVVNGIPNLVPTDGRIIKTKEEKPKPKEADQKG